MDERNTTQAAEFLATLYPEIEGYIEVRTIGNGKKPQRHFYAATRSIRWQDLSRANANGYNIYFGVGLRRRRAGRKEDVHSIPALWADLEGKDFADGKDGALQVLQQRLPPELQPSIVLDSGHGVHAYWLLREPYTLDGNGDQQQVEGIVRGLAEHLGGDRAVADVARVMRLPGFLNVKDPAEPIPCTTLEMYPAQRFNLDDFYDYLLQTPPVISGEPPEAPGVADWTKLSRATRYFLVFGGLKDDRNKGLFASACDMAGCGFSLEEARPLLLAAAGKRGTEQPEAEASILSAFSRPRTPTRQYYASTRATDGHGELLTVHLTDIDRAEQYGHRVTTPITVVGTGETFAVPKEVKGVICIARKDDVEECQSCPAAQRFDVIIPDDDPLVIAATAITTQRLEKLLAAELWRKARGGELGPRPSCESGRLAWSEIEARPLTELRVYPLAAELTLKNGETVDETGREYRKKDIFYLGAKAHNVQRFAARGMVLANPKTQVVTLLADSLEPVEADLTFDPAQVRQWPLERLDDLLDAWSCQVTKVYGRNDALLALLLAYASPLYFTFEEEQEKGWLEAAFVGDSTTGKGQTALRTRAALGCGSYALGECASRAGLLYGIEAGTRGHMLIWGELPQADGRLLIVDGANVISKEEWQQTREVRRQGFVSVRRIVSGEHPCRVRFVAIGNPADPMGRYMHPCEAVKDLFDPADIARFDVAILFDEADVPMEIINEPPGGEETLDLRWLHHNVLRAWQVKPDELGFTPEALRGIYSKATALAKRYQGANDIPLVTNDMKKKLARLSLSLALLLGETTAQAEHVAYIAHWLDGLYRRMRLDVYADEQRKKAKGGSEEEIGETLEWLEAEMASSDCMKTLVHDIFAQHPRLRLKDIVSRMAHTGGWAERTIKLHLSKLRGADLVVSGSGGYARKQKFVAVLRKLAQKNGGHTPEGAESAKSAT